MVSKSQELSVNQEKAVMAYMSEKTIKAAAEKVGIEERTFYRWLNQPEFKERIREEKDKTMKQVSMRLRTVATLAIDTIIELMDNKEVPASVRATATRTALEYCYKITEMEDLKERIDILESQMGKDGEKKWG